MPMSLGTTGCCGLFVTALGIKDSEDKVLNLRFLRIEVCQMGKWSTSQAEGTGHVGTQA